MSAPTENDITTYWKQIYQHLRNRCHCNHHEAEDLTQDLFARLVERGILQELESHLASEEQRRNYLFASARNLFASARRKKAAAKRGGGAQHLSIGSEHDADHIDPVSNTNTPSEVTQQRELRAHWQRELSILANDASLHGKLTLFTHVCGALSPGEHPVDSREVGRELGIAAGAVRIQIHRWRNQLLVGMRAQFDTEVAA